jgi:hypothetical protein
MIENNIQRSYVTNQPSRNDGVYAEVFCPMCEAWHENNTWCQMSWSDWS